MFVRNRARVTYMNKTWNWWKINRKLAITEAAAAGHVVDILVSKRSAAKFFRPQHWLTNRCHVRVYIFMWLGGKANPTWQRYSGGDTEQRSFFTHRIRECLYLYRRCPVALPTILWVSTPLTIMRNQLKQDFIFKVSQ